jgi:hypothetical protein
MSLKSDTTVLEKFADVEFAPQINKTFRKFKKFILLSTAHLQAYFSPIRTPCILEKDFVTVPMPSGSYSRSRSTTVTVRHCMTST